MGTLIIAPNLDPFALVGGQNYRTCLSTLLADHMAMQ